MNKHKDIIDLTNENHKEIKNDISGWSNCGLSHGRVHCGEGVSVELKDEALRIINMLREKYPHININMEIWPLVKTNLLDKKVG